MCYVRKPKNPDRHHSLNINISYSKSPWNESHSCKSNSIEGRTGYESFNFLFLDE